MNFYDLGKISLFRHGISFSLYTEKEIFLSIYTIGLQILKIYTLAEWVCKFAQYILLFSFFSKIQIKQYETISYY